MYRDELSRKDLKFKLKAQSLGIGSGGNSSIFKFQDIIPTEFRLPTDEELQLFDGVDITDVLDISEGIPIYICIQNGDFILFLSKIDFVDSTVIYGDTTTKYAISSDHKLLGKISNK